MKRVLFVTGEPGSGKSTLAEELAKNHSFVHLSVDDAYVEFVRDKCNLLFFEQLERYIAPHYNCILSERKFSKEQFGRDFVVEWYEYLLQQIIEELATQKDSVVVEGYLLKDCIGDLQAKLQGKAEMYRIQADNMEYKCNGQVLTVEQVAALGSDASPGA